MKTLTVSLLVLTSGSAIAGLLPPSFMPMGDLVGGNIYSQAVACSADGRSFAGYGTDASGTVGVISTNRAPWISGGDLAGGSYFSAFSGLSGDGTTAVGYSTGTTGTVAVRWTLASGIVAIGDLPGGSNYGLATAANQDGSIIVGWSESTAGTQAFRWIGNVMTGIGDLPGGSFLSQATGVSGDGSIICGFSSASTGYLAFRWTSAGMTSIGDLPGGVTASKALGISRNGTYIVGVSTSGNGEESFLWGPNGMKPLGDLPLGTFDGRAVGVSDDGKAAVGTSKTDKGYEGYLWRDGMGMRKLSDILTIDLGLVEANLWVIREITGISADGKTVCGWGNDDRGMVQAFYADIGGSYLAGTISCPDWSIGIKNLPTEIQFRDAGTGLVTWTRPLALDAAGKFGIIGPVSGLQDVYVRGRSSLWRKLSRVDMNGASALNLSAALLLGDIDRDNQVTILDYSLFSDAFDSVPSDTKWNELADLDGDKSVSILDFSILSNTFDQDGD